MTSQRSQVNDSNPELDEELSAFVDGQIERSRQRFVVKRLTEHAAVANRWSRYHLVRQVMRKESFAAIDLSARVASALETSLPIQQEQASHRFVKPVAGGLIAASVAVVALLGMNHSLLDSSSPGVGEAEQGFVSQTTPMDRVFSQPATPVGLGGGQSSADQQRLQRLMLQHQQAARGAGVGTYWPVVTLAPAEKATQTTDSNTNPATDRPQD
ncbi:MAG TPA: sigma-E factor negative regulatory protein [Wenzhouxiangella sp.]